MDEPRARRATRLIGVLIGLLLLARLAAMDLMPLMDTTEARYAEIARKMAELGDWVTPWFDYGVPFWGKPPLSFWLTAASFETLGVSEFAARLPHLLCGLLMAAITWRLARPRPRGEALAAIALLAGSALFFVASAAVMTDSALALGTTLAMAGFWLALHDPEPAVRKRWGWLFFLGLAVGLLAKGPVAGVLVVLPLLAWTALSPRRAEVWHRLPWLGGLLLLAAVTLPWYALAEQRTPGFLQYFIVGEHWHRFVTPGWQGDLYGTAHRYPPGAIWALAFGALLPWSVLLPMAAWWGHREPPPPELSADDRAWRRYLLLWSLTPLVFFTPARNVLWTYVLPAAPALALLAAGWLLRKLPPERAQSWLAAGMAISLLAAAGGLAAAMLSQRIEHLSTMELVRAYEQRRAPGQALVFVGHRPGSAMFYSRGKALLVEDDDALGPHIGGAGGFVAIPIGGHAAPPGRAASAAALVGHFGPFDLRYLAPTELSRAPPRAPGCPSARAQRLARRPVSRVPATAPGGRTRPRATCAACAPPARGCRHWRAAPARWRRARPRPPDRAGAAPGRPRAAARAAGRAPGSPPRLAVAAATQSAAPPRRRSASPPAPGHLSSAPPAPACCATRGCCPARAAAPAAPAPRARRCAAAGRCAARCLR